MNHLHFTATVGSPTQVNQALQAQQGLVLTVPEQEVRLCCPGKSNGCQATWPFTAYPTSGSITSAGVKAANTRTVRLIRAHVPSCVHRGQAPTAMVMVTATVVDTAVRPEVHVAAKVVAKTTDATPTTAGYTNQVLPAVTPTVVQPARESLLERTQAMCKAPPAVTPLAQVKQQLPCAIEKTFVHAAFGPVRVVALLLWSDITQPEPVPSSGKQVVCELYHTSADNVEINQPDPTQDETLFPMCDGWAAPVRMCFFHQIVLVEPAWCPLAVLYKEMFSSFHASNRALNASGGGFNTWHLLNNKTWTVGRVLSECGFRNPNWAAHDELTSVESLGLVIPEPERRQRNLAAKNMLRTGSLITAPANNDLTAMYISNGGYVSQEGLKTSSTVCQLQVAPRWIVSGMDERKQLRGSMREWAKSSQRFGEAAADGVFRDICIRDALALMCRLECVEHQCTEAQVRHHGTDAPADPAAKFVCCHNVVHEPYHAADYTNLTAGAAGGDWDIGHGQKAAELELVLIPKAAAATTWERCANSQTTGANADSHSRKRKRLANQREDQILGEDGVVFKKRRAPAFDPLLATPWDNRIKFQTLDPARVDLNRMHWWVAHAVKLLCDVYNFNLDEQQHFLMSYRWEKEQLGLIETSAAVQSFLRYWRKAPSDSHVRWVVVDRATGKEEEYAPPPAEWTCVQLVLKDPSQVPGSVSTSGRSQLQCTNVMVHKSCLSAC